MFLTSIIVSLGAAVVGEAIVTLRRKRRKRSPWEPSFHDMVSFRESNWKLVSCCQADRAAIAQMFEDGGLTKIDSFIWNNLSKKAGVTAHDWNQWTIDWRHGCIDKDGSRLGAGWSVHSGTDEVMIYLYDAVPVAPPKPAPEPAPKPAPSLWTALDDGQQILSYLRNPSAFWLEPTDYPWLRIYDDGTAVNSTNGASVRDYHVDFRFEPGKKRGYVIVTDDSHNGWKKKRYGSMAAADAAIQAYFKLRREQDKPAAYIERAISVSKKPDNCEDINDVTYKMVAALTPSQRLALAKGTSPSTVTECDTKQLMQMTDAQVRWLDEQFMPAFAPREIVSYNIERNHNGLQVYTIEGSDGQSRTFDRMKGAVDYLRQDGYSMDDILAMSGSHVRFQNALGPAKEPSAYGFLPGDVPPTRIVSHAGRPCIHISATDLLKGNEEAKLRGQRIVAYERAPDGGYLCILHEEEHHFDPAYRHWRITSAM